MQRRTADDKRAGAAERTHEEEATDDTDGHPAHVCGVAEGGEIASNVACDDEERAWRAWCGLRCVRVLCLLLMPSCFSCLCRACVVLCFRRSSGELRRAVTPFVPPT